MRNDLEPMKQKLRLNSFFAGIGGFDLGLSRAGFEVGFHCEINTFCRSVLKRHWPDTPEIPDIKRVDAKNIPDAEIWAGGFPCQDVSVARGWMGRDGLKGKSSGLFHPFVNLIAEQLPTVVLIENVTGLLSSHEGLDFEFVLKSLTDLGYGVAWRVLNSRYFGAPQSRPRVFVCAWYGSFSHAVRVLYEHEVSEQPANERKGFLTACKKTSSGAIVPEVAYCLAATSGRHTGTDWSRSYVSYYDRVRRLTPTECEGLQGFPSGWTLPEPNIKLAENELDSLRYAALGNAVCVPVVEWIAQRIKKEWNRKRTDKITAVDILAPFPTERPKTFLRLGEVKESCGRFKWSTGGYAWKGDCILSSVSPSPVKPIPCFFSDILENNSVNEGHFLSSNAAEGILRRVRGQNRTLFAPLEQALQRLADSQQQILPDDDSIFPCMKTALEAVYIEA
jgi:DNA (cytosine-5)-methyltransferase 1